jgi:hypothetical protein
MLKELKIDEGNRGWQKIQLCMNFIEGGGCHATGKDCLLGHDGDSARNIDDKCPLQGRFDVWVTQDDDLLISDIGSPSDEPKQCLALGVNKTLAEEIARGKSKQLGTRVLTTQRRCLGCSRVFWITEHRDPSGLAEIGHGHFCPDCIAVRSDEIMEKNLGRLRYWCG